MKIKKYLLIEAGVGGSSNMSESEMATAILEGMVKSVTFCKAVQTALVKHKALRLAVELDKAKEAQ